MGRGREARQRSRKLYGVEKILVYYTHIQIRTVSCGSKKEGEAERKKRGREGGRKGVTEKQEYPS